MAGSPRIVFLALRDADDPMLQHGFRHVQALKNADPSNSFRTVFDRWTSVLGGDGTGSAEFTGIVLWRIISANNRELARSAEIYPTFAEARDHARRVQADAALVSAHSVVDVESGSYGWYLSLDQTPVVISRQWYQIERDASYSRGTVVEALPTSTIAPAARLVQSRHPGLDAGPARHDTVRARIVDAEVVGP